MGRGRYSAHRAEANIDRPAGLRMGSASKEMERMRTLRSRHVRCRLCHFLCATFATRQENARDFTA
jgi:nitrate/TMAO reductase-like tetraheme cytochrome c subunit